VELLLGTCLVDKRNASLTEIEAGYTKWFLENNMLCNWK